MSDDRRDKAFDDLERRVDNLKSALPSFWHRTLIFVVFGSALGFGGTLVVLTIPAAYERWPAFTFAVLVLILVAVIFDTVDAAVRRRRRG